MVHDPPQLRVYNEDPRNPTCCVPSAGDLRLVRGGSSIFPLLRGRGRVDSLWLTEPRLGNQRLGFVGYLGVEVTRRPAIGGFLERILDPRFTPAPCMDDTILLLRVWTTQFPVGE